MSFKTVNPATGEEIREFSFISDAELESALERSARAAHEWKAVPLAERCDLLRKAGRRLRERRDELASLITLEMGKLTAEARGEVEKCAWVCEFYADKAAEFLADEVIETDAGKSLVAYQPLGPVFAIMPWNFPFWQVFRFAAPALAAGNVGLLKHASNVPECARAIEAVFREAGFPDDVFQNLFISIDQAAHAIRDMRVRAVTLTGSGRAGRSVAETAGHALKKTVLELGGSDAFVVLEDADLESAVEWAVKARFQNAGQSCIAAKRFIVVEDVADEFVARFRAAAEALVPGDPTVADTTLGPMARADLRDSLHEQVSDALDNGAEAVTGCEPLPGDGYFYKPSILDRVQRGMRAWREELFGPVASVIRVADEAEGLQVANANTFGLGGSVWTRDAARGEAFARRMECGAAFVNGMVKSDPRLPFGGIKESGYGRELSHHGIREFVNAKTLWIK
jgi:succinate-semialdehyde dehydrogenase/glutarate-semialdehyde dehydrogenase